MSRIILLFLAIVMLSPAFGQRKKRPKAVMWDQWYDSTAFFRGYPPLVEGYGKLSDSLSLVHDGMTIYENEGQYYRINCLADYYFWFTRKFPFLFKDDIAHYEQLYFAGNSFQVARFIKENYKGRKFPVKFRFTSYYSSVGTVPSVARAEPDRLPTIPNPSYLSDH